jgi:hypothetical protein
MSFSTVDGYMLRRFIINGANLLINNKEEIDALNVFPVPDGDTGTNMSMTAASAAEAVQKVNSPNIGEVAKAAASGALRGARGNSGVILSQIFRGIARGLDGKATADCAELADAFVCAKETAYRAVMKPKEGTILTIIRALADKAQEAAQSSDSIEVMLKAMLSYAQSVLAATPDMLPQLKEAGVVDSGGSGLLLVIEGGYKGIGIDSELATPSESTDKGTPTPSAISDTEIKYGYCTEFFVNLDNVDPENVKDELTSYLSKIGDSLVVVADDDIIKIHVHTDNPGLVLERALKIGSLDKIKIENMRIQHTNLINFSQPAKTTEINKEINKDFGFVAVAQGEGIAEVFKELGCDEIITGGQTMNPSTEDILEAIERVNAKNIFVLPNNKNIVLAAEQAVELCTDKNIILLESTTIPQGVAAMVAFIPDLSAEDNKTAMSLAMDEVATGHATYAVRSTTIDGKEIKKGDYLFMLDGKITGVDTDLKSGILTLVDEMLEQNEDAAFVNLYYGEDVKKEDAESLLKELCDKHSDIDFELTDGGQSVYYYIISVE